MAKLVRDLIPSLVKERSFRIAEQAEYAESLLAKLAEETEEYRQNPCLEELSDILEVVYALAEQQGYTLQELETARLKKLKERGGFKNRVIMN